MRLVAVALCMLGCGRLAFDPAISDGPPAADAVSSDGTLAPCVDGDGACLPACVGADTDCITTCGDSRCVGNAGELCSTCMADCMSMAAICGNGACDSGEDGTTCPADCGPAVWPWAQEEADLIAEVNARRTAGVTCPGDTMRTAPALSLDTTMQPGAREYAWEIGHHQYYAGDGISCNGRTFAMRQDAHGANGGTSYSSPTSLTANAVVASWLSSASLCPVVMLTSRTQLAVGVVHDADHGYVVWFK